MFVFPIANWSITYKPIGNRQSIITFPPCVAFFQITNSFGRFTQAVTPVDHWRYLSFLHERADDRLPQPNQYVSGLLTERAEALLEKLENSKSMRGRVESFLIPILHTGEANMETIARKLAISRQTLFRKLKAEGVTFEQVLDELTKSTLTALWFGSYCSS